MLVLAQLSTSASYNVYTRKAARPNYLFFNLFIEKYSHSYLGGTYFRLQTPGIVTINPGAEVTYLGAIAYGAEIQE